MNNKLKKIAVLLSALVLFSGCSSETAEVTDTQAADTVMTEADTQRAEQTENEVQLPSEELPELPIMDGSTSAAPLEIGLKAGKLGISYTEAKELVSHTTTHDSFKRLINGEVDLIFSVPISQEQQKMADDAGVKLIMQPVAKEGFVFVVNGENPVDSLTVQQIQDIYSGKITNWAELGGKNAEILPYQRNTDSGSQNYMIKFMDDVPLSPPKSDYISGAMGALMDAIATYDNSEGAIGYSVYSYAAQMYANANKIKFVAIDGVKPSKSTMADESYPLLSSTYIIYTDKSPESAAEFADWVLSDEGQGYVLESGYLPVNGMEIPDKYMPYEAVGTGEEKAEGTKPDMRYSQATLYCGSGITVIDDEYFQLDCLKDTEFQAQINEDLKAAVDSLKPYYEKKYVNIYRENNLHGITITSTTRNGYISFILGYQNQDIRLPEYIMTSYSADNIYDHAVTLTYDLIEKKKIEKFSDLFYKDSDFAPIVNNGISDTISQYFVPETNVTQKIEFSGILGEPRLFTIDRVGFEGDNPYFDCGPMLEFILSPSSYKAYDLSPLSIYRNMTDIFTEKFLDIPYNIWEFTDPEWETDYYEEDGILYTEYIGSRFHTDEETARENEAIKKVQHIGVDFLQSHRTYIDPIYRPIFRKGDNGTYWRVYITQVALDTTAIIDAGTYKILTCEDLFGENWSNYLTEDIGEIEDYIPLDWQIEGDSVVGHLMNKQYFTTAKVPFEEVNHRYITKDQS